MIMLVVLVSMIVMISNLQLSLGLPTRASKVIEVYRTISLPSIKIVMVVMLNIMVMLTINGVYLTVILTRGVNVPFFQFLLGIFKSLWNVMMFTCGRGLARSQQGWYWFGLILSILNLIVIPCLSTLLTESACLYPLFTPSVIPSATIKLLQCAEFKVLPDGTYVCIQFTTSFLQLPDLTAPFIYNYGCASALIVAYVPVLIYSMITSGVVWPLMQLFVCILDEVNFLTKDQRALIWPGFRLSIIHQDVRRYDDLNFELVNTLMSLLVYMLVFVTFGLASPFLGLVTTVCFSVRLETYVFLIRRFQYLSSFGVRDDFMFRGSELEMSRSSLRKRESQVHLSSSTMSSQFAISHPSPICADVASPLSVDHRSSVSVPQANDSPTLSPTPSPPLELLDLTPTISKSFLFMSLVAGLFWSFLSFEMIGDVHGAVAGRMSVLVLPLTLLLSSMLYMVSRNIDRKECLNHAVVREGKEPHPSVDEIGLASDSFVLKVVCVE